MVAVTGAAAVRWQEWVRFCIYFNLINFFLGEEKEKEGEKHQCAVASQAPPTGDLACNPGTCPDW